MLYLFFIAALIPTVPGLLRLIRFVAILFLSRRYTSADLLVISIKGGSYGIS